MNLLFIKKFHLVSVFILSVSVFASEGNLYDYKNRILLIRNMFTTEDYNAESAVKRLSNLALQIEANKVKGNNLNPEIYTINYLMDFLKIGIQFFSKDIMISDMIGQQYRLIESKLPPTILKMLRENRGGFAISCESIPQEFTAQTFRSVIVDLKTIEFSNFNKVNEEIDAMNNLIDNGELLKSYSKYEALNEVIAAMDLTAKVVNKEWNLNIKNRPRYLINTFTRLANSCF